MGNSNSGSYDLNKRGIFASNLFLRNIASYLLDSIDFDPVDMKLTKNKANFVHYDSSTADRTRSFVNDKSIPRHTIGNPYSLYFCTNF
jgi:hypothetical protein